MDRFVFGLYIACRVVSAETMGGEVKVVLFCGGLGTRIRDYPEPIPKPLIPVAGRPIVRHVMDIYHDFGIDEFILCLGYKGDLIRRHFSDAPDPTLTVDLVDTGDSATVGGRLWAVRHLLQDEAMFCANYSDGLADVDLDTMRAKFANSDAVACLLAVRPALTFHFIDFDERDEVRRIADVRGADIWMNGGFFLFRREIFSYMREGEELVEAPFQRLMAERKLMVHRHEGFFRPMDTLRDRQALEDMAAAGETPWRRHGGVNARLKGQ